MERLISGHFFGDTTVLFSGKRSHYQNGPDSAEYLRLAKQRGWAMLVPFVVLDRPATSITGRIEFTKSEVIKELDFGGRYKQFSLSGGFAASETVVHHAHLTFHGLTGLSLCMNGLAMGLSGRSGKLAMHMGDKPEISNETCNQCGDCIATCPEGALREQKDQQPLLDPVKCIGCGECQARCPEGAIRIIGSNDSDLSKGASDLSFRMVDYLMGLMDGRWENIVNVAHLYNITGHCDCLDAPQKTVCQNIGFLVGRNPFAVDNAARQILKETLVGEKYLRQAEAGRRVFDYVTRNYQVVTRPEVETIMVNVSR
jgi:uncharacterized Fe-S center protein